MPKFIKLHIEIETSIEADEANELFKNIKKDFDKVKSMKEIIGLIKDKKVVVGSIESTFNSGEDVAIIKVFEINN